MVPPGCLIPDVSPKNCGDDDDDIYQFVKSNPIPNILSTPFKKKGAAG